MNAGRYTIVENYRGYEIVHYKEVTNKCEYYFIKLNGERATQQYLNSPLAARNVIDTHFRFIENNKIKYTNG